VALFALAFTPVKAEEATFGEPGSLVDLTAAGCVCVVVGVNVGVELGLVIGCVSGGVDNLE